MVTPAVPSRGGKARGGEAAARPRWRVIARRIVIGIIGLALVTSPWSVPRLLSQLDYFHVRRIEFEGVHFSRHDELLAALAVDTTRSIWADLAPLDSAVGGHPMIASARVERRFPGTLLVHVVERAPVALVARRGVLVPLDVEGTVLPIEPARTPVDVPIVETDDGALLRTLDLLRRTAPRLFARIVQAGRAGPDHLVFDLGDFRVRTRDEVTVARFRDILPVEADLTRDGLRVTEMDLRFQDQVIVRLP